MLFIYLAVYKYLNKVWRLYFYIQMKETLDNADLDHQKTLKRMEQKFLNDKV